MKTLGIIGGLGPESTVNYYQTIIRLYRERVGGDVYPQFFINNMDLNKVREPVLANDLPRLANNIIAEIEKLARAGAEFGLIAANTPHLAFDEIAARSPIPLISIVEATCAVAKNRQFKRLAIFGTKFTMNGQFYARPFTRAGIDLVRPPAADQDYIHDKYMNELVAGKFLPETKAGLLAIVDRMRAKFDPSSQSYGEAGIDAVILAGTELPLILREPQHNGIPFLNTTVIHCEAAVTKMFS
ncbi:MAG TPA: amino acid racemase [Chthoniobacterales bacterium]|nr:amino acid racemase [Chthoniobacterales bacterium]